MKDDILNDPIIILMIILFIIGTAASISSVNDERHEHEIEILESEIEYLRTLSL